jgi:hypothetical protein
MPVSIMDSGANSGSRRDWGKDRTHVADVGPHTGWRPWERTEAAEVFQRRQAIRKAGEYGMVNRLMSDFPTRIAFACSCERGFRRGLLRSQGWLTFDLLKTRIVVL